MKSNPFKVPIILLIPALFLFSCNTEPPTGPGAEVDQALTQVEGSWIAYHTVYLEEDKILDVSEYFEGFKISINKNQSCCDFNGCESWTTSSKWESEGDYYNNYFMNHESGDIMSLSIHIQGSEKALTAEIKIEEPGFSFLPEGKNTGEFIIELRYVSDIEESYTEGPIKKGGGNGMD